MTAYDFDLFVIGGGSGGVRAARLAAGLGARVGIAEERYFGGTCVNVGCVPKKLFVHAAEFSHAFRDSQGFGWASAEAQFHWPTLLSNKNTEIERLNAIYENLLEEAGVRIFEDRAVLCGPQAVAVGEKVFHTRRILIATGGWPQRPDIPGNERAITSNEAFYLKELPNEIAIVGGGYIGVEFAGIFNGLGVKTHLIYRGSRLLKHFDHDLGTALAEAMTASGINVQLNTQVDSIEQHPIEGLSLRLSSEKTITCNTAMFATGRRPQTEGLGLETTAVTLDASGAIEVDPYFQTREPSIYAIGDVINRVQLTPVAIREAVAVVDHLFGAKSAGVDYQAVPTAVFSQPPLASAGYTEQQAKQILEDVDIYRTRFVSLKQRLAGDMTGILIKLVVDRSTDRVVGCHMLGEGAADVIQGLAIAMTAGATKADFDRTIGIHPSTAEEFVTLRNALD